MKKFRTLLFIPFLISALTIPAMAEQIINFKYKVVVEPKLALSITDGTETLSTSASTTSVDSTEKQITALPYTMNYSGTIESNQSSNITVTHTLASGNGLYLTWNIPSTLASDGAYTRSDYTTFSQSGSKIYSSDVTGTNTFAFNAILNGDSTVKASSYPFIITFKAYLE